MYKLDVCKDTSEEEEIYYIARTNNNIIEFWITSSANEVYNCYSHGCEFSISELSWSSSVIFCHGFYCFSTRKNWWIRTTLVYMVQLIINHFHEKLQLLQQKQNWIKQTAGSSFEIEFICHYTHMHINNNYSKHNINMWCASHISSEVKMYIEYIHRKHAHNNDNYFSYKIEKQYCFSKWRFYICFSRSITALTLNHFILFSFLLLSLLRKASILNRNFRLN